MRRGVALLNAGVVTTVLESDHYTSWRCSVCHEWRERTYPARITQTGTKVRIECREHPEIAAKDEVCSCHCHESNYCEECGERSW